MRAPVKGIVQFRTSVFVPSLLSGIGVGAGCACKLQRTTSCTI